MLEIYYKNMFQNTNEKLNDSLTDMTEKIVRLEAKEQDLVTQLQLKVWIGVMVTCKLNCRVSQLVLVVVLPRL